MTERVSERDLVIKFRHAKYERDKMKEALKLAEDEYAKTESALIELLESNSAEASAKYDGLGYVRIMKPRLYANCKNEDQGRLFEYLRECDRTDLIKTAVPAQSLSSFVSECIDNGKQIPEYVSYYLKTSLRLID